MAGRHRSVTRTFVDLADTLVADFDLADFLHTVTVRCQETLGVAAVGLLLADKASVLNVVAASSEHARLLEVLEVQNEEGPCRECYLTREPVSCDLSREPDRWPRFTRVARQLDFTIVYALPMRLRTDIIGSLNLFATAEAEPDAELLDVAQALADVATIGLLHERAIRQHELFSEQLQEALDSRVVIEQAKGVLAERAAITVTAAFDALRAYARGNRMRLVDVATAVIHRDPRVADLLPGAHRFIRPGEHH